jgi:DNA-binding MarR family transcriptional regulator
MKAVPETTTATGEDPHPKLTDLNEFIPGVITWLYNRYSADSSRSYRNWYGLGVTDWRVLAYLGVNKEGTAATISKFINLDKAATSRSIQMLKSEGLVEITQTTGRKIFLILTPAGQKAFDEISVLALDRESALLTGFSKGEISLLNEMLHRMLANVPLVSHVMPRTLRGSEPPQPYVRRPRPRANPPSDPLP